MRINSRNLFTPQLKVIVVATMSTMKEEALILSKALLKVKIRLKAVQFGEKFKEKLQNEKK
jgi:hypothetical protein